MKPSRTAFIGYWRIEEMDNWDEEFFDEYEPAHITFKRDGLGEMHFCVVDVGLDWRYDPEAGRVEFTFEGFDDSDPVSGRGWAKLEEKQLEGYFAFHLGEESGFSARKGR